MGRCNISNTLFSSAVEGMALAGYTIYLATISPPVEQVLVFEDFTHDLLLSKEHLMGLGIPTRRYKHTLFGSGTVRWMMVLNLDADKKRIISQYMRATWTKQELDVIWYAKDQRKGRVQYTDSDILRMDHAFSI